MVLPHYVRVLVLLPPTLYRCAAYPTYSGPSPTGTAHTMLIDWFNNSHAISAAPTNSSSTDAKFGGSPEAISIPSLFAVATPLLYTSTSTTTTIVTITSTAIPPTSTPHATPTSKPTSTDLSFSGDDSVYGIGVRIGMYAQWVASVIAYSVLEDHALTRPARIMWSDCVLKILQSARVLNAVKPRSVCIFST